MSQPPGAKHGKAGVQTAVGPIRSGLLVHGLPCDSCLRPHKAALHRGHAMIDTTSYRPLRCLVAVRVQKVANRKHTCLKWCLRISSSTFGTEMNSMTDGYAKVAQLMCHSREFGMIRGFGALQVENILFLQAQVNQLEGELQKIVERDRIANHPQHPFYHRCWWSLNHSADFGNQEQLGKRHEIRAALKEYSAAHPSCFQSGLLISTAR